MNSEQVPSSSLRRLLLFLKRGVRLSCPECGLCPVFKRPSRVRGIDDWLRPLDGCPRCRYRYEREQGYFLLATWVINYAVVGGAGLFLAFTVGGLFELSFVQQLMLFVAPMPVFSLLLARHAKAVFLAIDHFCDPARQRSGSAVGAAATQGPHRG